LVNNLEFKKKLSDIPIEIQIAHAGRKGSAFIPWIKSNKSLNKRNKSWITYAPSAIKRDKGWPIPRELTESQIKKIIINFKDAALKAKKIGFDYVCVSSGGILPITNLKFYKGFSAPFTKIIKKNTSIITRTSGLITDVHQANKLLKNKNVDLIAMARTFINDPMWIYKAAKKIKNNKIIPSQYLRCF